MEADFHIQDFSHLTDVLGSLQMIKRYSLISLFFTTPGDSSPESITDGLNDALRKLAQAFPYLAGRVVYDGRDDAHTGIRKIVPHEGVIPLLVKDFCTDADVASMEDMVAARFPMRMLDPQRIVPPIAMTWATDNFDKYAPVLILQANIIRGGLILTIAGNHATMDMTGLGIVISFIAKACGREPFTDEEIEEGNQDRRNVVPLLDDSYQPGSELDDSLIKPPPPDAPPMTIPPAKWVYLNFPSSPLPKLKTAASDQSVVPYISTDDAISALLWQRITHARATLHPTLHPFASQLCRTVSLRSFLKLKGYIGHLVDCVYARLPDVHNLPLGEIAGRLRLQLRDEAKIVQHMRAYATALHRLDDKTQIVNGAQLNPNVDVVVSSYANLKCSELDFGAELGGNPVAARRPRMDAWPSLLYIMPRDRNGETAVAVCLPEEELEVLKRDEVLAKFAAFTE
ncbi:uncharacterized protein HMPREF1541_01566 [Cyphellophora europaea CBS 101466]|uniref:Trichothecene 3-O-acetyltransferase-like N-terminal domain-containing protein n=1 Tax=Cyphellophora europaea (strain CBS 101466) TaxID=1220924 RepID=W2S178_CYPE1|nr:uncharacterized protein HMPREF1541_01566 [Cyphellophora europaea CBS 101466]ETN42412.1 hypothetical protein HMPREF1541_01566 [Cyphellophora europaea CBS 101466]